MRVVQTLALASVATAALTMNLYRTMEARENLRELEDLRSRASSNEVSNSSYSQPYSDNPFRGYFS